MPVSYTHLDVYKRQAIKGNPQGIVASMSMNNLYIETATELVSVFNLLDVYKRQGCQVWYYYEGGDGLMRKDYTESKEIGRAHV